MKRMISVIFPRVTMRSSVSAESASGTNTATMITSNIAPIIFLLSGTGVTKTM